MRRLVVRKSDAKRLLIAKKKQQATAILATTVHSVVDSPTIFRTKFCPFARGF